MNIFESLTAINKEIKAIAKDRKNEQQGFKFRGIDDVMNELHDLFAKHGVLIVPEAETLNTEERTNAKGTVIIWTRQKINYTFFAEDGTSIKTTVFGEGMDSGDKGANKAMSIALKYVLLQMFLIPTEDAKDPDAETHEVGPKKATDEQIGEITDLMISYPQERIQKALAYYKVNALSELTEAQAASMIVTLKKANNNATK